MKLLIVVSLIIVFLFTVLEKAITYFKSNLFRDHRAWSGKDIKINRQDLNADKRNLSSNIKTNYLNVIAEESKIFLDKQS